MHLPSIYKQSFNLDHHIKNVRKFNLFGHYLHDHEQNIISNGTGGKPMVDCSRYLGIKIFHFVVVAAELYEYPNCALKYGNSRFPTALGSYPDYL